MAKKNSALVDAALALEEQLEELDELARKAQKLPLDDLDNIRKTTDALARVGAMEEQLAARLQGLMAAIGELAQRQQQQGDTLRARADELASRREAHDALAARYIDLGRVASEINGSMQQLLEAQTQAPANEARATAVMTARQISGQLEGLMATADAVHADAVAQQFRELERQTHALRQQIGAARQRIDKHVLQLEGAPN
jgi:hypothetical protein